jgi:hypothetical protein
MPLPEQTAQRLEREVLVEPVQVRDRSLEELVPVV